MRNGSKQVLSKHLASTHFQLVEMGEPKQEPLNVVYVELAKTRMSEFKNLKDKHQ